MSYKYQNICLNQFWKILFFLEKIEKNEQLWSNLDKFWPIKTNLNQSEQVWSSLDMFEPICSGLIQFAQVWTNVDKFDPIKHWIKVKILRNPKYGPPP